MAWVFDDQAILDRYQGYLDEGKKVRPLENISAGWWRGSRALTHLLNLISLRLHGTSAGWWHAENAALHVLNALLVWHLFGGLAGVLFLVHPIAGGLCVYAQLRADLVMTLAALLSVQFYVWGGLWLIGSVICFWLSRSGKACGVLVTPIFWLMAWCLFG